MSQRQQNPHSIRHQSWSHRSIQCRCRRDRNWIRQSHRHQLPVRFGDRTRELKLYTEAPAKPIAECPLSQWAKNQATDPSVAAVARHMLAIPATSVSSERLFSKAGDVLTKKRNRLAPSKADRVVFLMDNL